MILILNKLLILLAAQNSRNYGNGVLKDVLGTAVLARFFAKEYSYNKQYDSNCDLYP
jgi:hypothetical protein